MKLKIAYCTCCQDAKTRHDGSLSTVHANTAEDVLLRLETMMLMGNNMPIQAIRRQIVSGVDVIVHLGRLRDHSRKVLEIIELIGLENGGFQIRKLYEFVEYGREDKVVGSLKKREEMQGRKKLLDAGIEM